MKSIFRKTMPNTVARRNPVVVSSALQGNVGSRVHPPRKAYTRHERHRRKHEDQA
jgi:hypothetical protein